MAASSPPAPPSSSSSSSSTTLPSSPSSSAPTRSGAARGEEWAEQPYLLGDYLRRVLPTFHGPVQAVKFPFGQSNPTYLLHSPSHTLVLRKKPGGKIVHSAHAIEREFKVMDALHRVGFPVPRVYHLCEDASIIGTPFYLMEFVRGRVFVDPAMPELAPSERAACYTSALETLARLHAVDFRAAGLEDFGKQGGHNYYKRQLRRLLDVSERQTIFAGPIPDVARMQDWFAAHLPPDEVAIIHGDFKVRGLCGTRKW